MIKCPKFESVPVELRDRRQWILWRRFMRDGREVKMPWSVYDAPASSTDPATWHEYECCVMRFDESRHAGIGYVFDTDDGFAGIDLDACRHPETGHMASWAQKWIDKSGDCYAEISPSETGVKIWIRSETQLDRGRNIKIDEAAIIPGGKKPGIEIYTHGRYFAFTGHVIRNFDNGRR